MAENLKAAHYRNGDEIATGLDNDAWQTTTDGAYAVYDDDPDYAWIAEDSDGNDTGGLLTPDDIPNYARTSSTGVGEWTLQYSEGVNIPQGDDPVTYQTFNTTIYVSLITPSTNNPSETATIIIIKSEED